MCVYVRFPVRVLQFQNWNFYRHWCNLIIRNDSHWIRKIKKNSHLKLISWSKFLNMNRFRAFVVSGLLFSGVFLLRKFSVHFFFQFSFFFWIRNPVKNSFDVYLFLLQFSIRFFFFPDFSCFSHFVQREWEGREKELIMCRVARFKWLASSLRLPIKKVNIL